MQRTRIKMCGLTRKEDVDAAVLLGADAVGFVFYPPSPRFVDYATAALLARRVPPFVVRVGLFVNAEVAEVNRVLAEVPLELLQFHGDEDESYCAAFGRPYLKVARMRAGVNLLEFARIYRGSQGILLDAWVEEYGGVGRAFDWKMIPADLPVPLVLSGGLDAANVGGAIACVRPWAVDVSSGIESAKGIKNIDKMSAFVTAVKTADVKRNFQQ